MKKLSTIIILLLLMTNVFAKGNFAFIVPIKGEINGATETFVKESIEKAETNKTSIVFEIDTYGGYVKSAEKIKNYILNAKIPTIAFVNNKAESAGVLISIACEKLYMAENSTIGSAETIPATEKNISFWRTLLKDTAEKRGKNAKVVEAMADKDLVIDGLTKEGKLVNLTAKESLDFGVSDGTCKDLNEVFQKEGITSSEDLKMPILAKAVNLISNPYISTLILTIAVAAFVIEIFSPGFGLAGGISVLAFAFYFLGNILAGNSYQYAIFIFLIGVALIIVESIIPGFGLPGIFGIISIVIGLVLTMRSLDIALMGVASSMIVGGVISYVFVKQGIKSPFIQKITLRNSTSADFGYSSHDKPNVEIGSIGKSLTPLKPTGYIIIGDKKYEAISEIGYISKDEEVEVTEIKGTNIFVRRYICQA
ncbi:nodulation protein NfeD [Peptoniphilus sp. BV3C26]|uniref:NfeD family protein n=1 Tax=Peptoniphilus sp. BV3C26 TaxID=1111134 RepID=UPI0003B86548|nr:NfeD family protein [Peptoniphilus sp. BV3C26]ERT57535.1 nodulation efficiency protein NfeD [Peptoniphilus sp. BV3C26]